MDIEPYLREKRRTIDQALRRALPLAATTPATIHEAMRYSLFVGGKRLRPILTLAAAEACGGREKDAMPLALAVECIHTYSLIHDDLPCMDDDALRRGQPTSHKVYGEAIAILAGDALLTHAFALAATAPPNRRYTTADIIAELAHASGSRGLIAGQVLDLEAEGSPTIEAQQLRTIHRRKTGALLTSSIVLGAMSAGATSARLQTLRDFGSALGLAFQIIDDILDCTQSSQVLGKSAGKDQAAQKATYPAILGLDASRREAHRLTHRAIRDTRQLGKAGKTLEAIAHRLLDREY